MKCNSSACRQSWELGGVLRLLLHFQPPGVTTLLPPVSQPASCPCEPHFSGTSWGRGSSYCHAPASPCSGCPPAGLGSIPVHTALTFLGCGVLSQTCMDSVLSMWGAEGQSTYRIHRSFPRAVRTRTMHRLTGSDVNALSHSPRGRGTQVWARQGSLCGRSGMTVLPCTAAWGPLGCSSSIAAPWPSC